MSRILTILRWLQKRAENVMALLLASMFATFLLQITFRYVLNLPLGWTVEYVTMAWLWGILFGYAFVLRDSEIIRLDILYLAVPTKIQHIMDLITNIIVVLVLVWSLPKAYDFVTFMKIERTAFMRIPFDLVFSIYIPFILSVIIRGGLHIARAVRGLFTSEQLTQASEGQENV